jgi:PIN domain nuclease of toxin-antitoxin system
MEQPEKRQTLTDNYESYTNEKIKLEREVNSLSENLSLLNKISSLELELEGLVKNAETNKMDKEAIDLISNILSALDEYISVLVVDKK